MDAIEMLKTRHSVRAFQDRAVPREIIEEIVDCGRLAASAINIQPWEFVVVTDGAVRRRLAADHGPWPFHRRRACLRGGPLPGLEILPGGWQRRDREHAAGGARARLRSVLGGRRQEALRGGYLQDGRGPRRLPAGEPHSAGLPG